MSDSSVLETRHGAVAIITLNKASETRNAFDLEMRAAMSRAIFNARDDDSVKVVIITGSKGVFCAGGDLKSLSAEKRTRIEAYPYFTPREIFAPEVERLLGEMESRPMMRSAVNRVRNAQGLAERLDEFFALVPQPGGFSLAGRF